MEQENAACSTSLTSNFFFNFSYFLFFFSFFRQKIYVKDINFNLFKRCSAAKGHTTQEVGFPATSTEPNQGYVGGAGYSLQLPPVLCGYTITRLQEQRWIFPSILPNKRTPSGWEERVSLLTFSDLTFDSVFIIHSLFLKVARFSRTNG